MLQSRRRVTKLRNRATSIISPMPVIPPVSETTMRNLDTWTGGLFAVAAIVLALEAVLAL